MAERILAVDDNPVNLKVVRATLIRAGYDVFTASNGLEALAILEEMVPDIILLDITMPDMDGYEVCRRLRAKPETAHVPVMMLTAHDSLDEKVKGFEAGADDYLTKPFQPAELQARIKVHLRRSAAIETPKQTEISKVISVFSLRGGVGVSSLVTNLACGLAGIWEKPVAIIDLSLTMGQAALLLNLPLRHTWLDLAGIPVNEIDYELLKDVMLTHDSGVSVLAAPRHVEEGEMVTAEMVTKVIKVLKHHFSYIVLDLPHDFRETTLAGLDVSDEIMALSAPDLASIRAMSELLETFKRLNYSENSSKLILNWVFERRGLAKKDIEGVLKRKIDFVIPFASEQMVQSINLGKPVWFTDPESDLGEVFEEIAYQISKKEDVQSKPENPSQAWLRLNPRGK
ncbi:MAG: response regulator receiver protein [Anaerolineaceae bacterium]|nr:response regulator receiver protein [Anaerolineaceae bacterium]